MSLVYVPRGTNRKSKAHLAEVAAKYLTNGRYDQRKSDMVAITHKENIGKTQRNQAVLRRELRKSAIVFMNFEQLITKTLVCEEESPKMVSPSPMQITPAKTKIDKLRTPGALVQSKLMTTGTQGRPKASKRKPQSQKRKSSFAIGKARL